MQGCSLQGITSGGRGHRMKSDVPMLLGWFIGAVIGVSLGPFVWGTTLTLPAAIATVLFVVAVAALIHMVRERSKL